MVSMMFVMLLVGCSGSLDKELETYLDDVVVDSQEKAYEELDEVEQKYLQALEAGETKEVVAILEEEYIPAVEAVKEDVEAYEAEQEEIEELNDLLIEEYTTFEASLQEKARAFEQLMEMESDEDLQAAIKTVDEVTEKSEAYVDALVAFDEKIQKLVDENNPDTSLETDEKRQSMDRDDVQDDVYQEFGLFIEGLGYSQEIFDTGELGESIGTIDAENELQVELIGEVQVDDGYVIEGESNLPEGAELEAVIYVYGEEASKGHTAKTDEDGSFEIEVPDLDVEDEVIEMQVRFRPADQTVELQDIYGEVGEEMEGDYIYRYSSIKRTYHEARVSAFIEADEQDAVVFEQPSWDPPKDYGELDIWVEIENVEEKDDYYNITAESNFVEGTKLTGDIEVPGYETAGFKAYTLVQPDGSFNMQIEKPDVEEEIIFQLEMLPKSLLLIETEELYGEDGEHLKGDLVEEHKDGQKIHVEYSMQKGKQVNK